MQHGPQELWIYVYAVESPCCHPPSLANTLGASAMMRDRATQFCCVCAPVLVLPRSPSGAAAALLRGPRLRSAALFFPVPLPLSCEPNPTVSLLCRTAH